MKLAVNLLLLSCSMLSAYAQQRVLRTANDLLGEGRAVYTYYSPYPSRIIKHGNFKWSSSSGDAGNGESHLITGTYLDDKITGVWSETDVYNSYTSASQYSKETYKIVRQYDNGVPIGTWYLNTQIVTVNGSAPVIESKVGQVSFDKAGFITGTFTYSEKTPNDTSGVYATNVYAHFDANGIYDASPIVTIQSKKANLKVIFKMRRGTQIGAVAINTIKGDTVRNVTDTAKIKLLDSLDNPILAKKASARLSKTDYNTGPQEIVEKLAITTEPRKYLNWLWKLANPDGWQAPVIRGSYNFEANTSR